MARLFFYPALDVHPASLEVHSAFHPSLEVHPAVARLFFYPALEVRLAK